MQWVCWEADNSAIDLVATVKRRAHHWYCAWHFNCVSFNHCNHVGTLHVFQTCTGDDECRETMIGVLRGVIGWCHGKLASVYLFCMRACLCRYVYVCVCVLVCVCVCVNVCVCV